MILVLYNGVLLCQTSIDSLVSHCHQLSRQTDNPFLKEHFNTIAFFAEDTTHGFVPNPDDQNEASLVLKFLKENGSEWKTYLEEPRPLMKSFKSKKDGKMTYYWVILPKDFSIDKSYPLYLELHGSGGGSNDNPRNMLFRPLQPELQGVTSQGYRKDALFVYPWGRGDKRYQDTAEVDIFEVIENFDEDFQSDPARQYLYGFSMGGAGTFHIASLSPERWTAIAAYSAAFWPEPDSNELKKLIHLPVWMVWGEEEKWATGDKIARDFFISHDMNISWEEIQGVGHKYLGEYQEKMLDWLKSYR
ncbi:MAG: hypothetical protein KDC53_19055 [Saprospiraceae bacterium]|nr:hypothetical protein [Saprospiraceae bacterium]